MNMFPHEDEIKINELIQGDGGSILNVRHGVLHGGQACRKLQSRILDDAILHQVPQRSDLALGSLLLPLTSKSNQEHLRIVSRWTTPLEPGH